MLRNYCERCKKSYDVSAIVQSIGVPHCDCGGIIKPDVVLYEEGLDADTLTKSVSAIQKADVLAVYPAAGLIDYYRGNRLVLINKSTTPYDRHADLLVQGSIGQILGAIQVAHS